MMMTQEQPAIPEEKPVSTEEKLEAAEAKPVSAEEKPASADEKPVSAEEKPVSAEEKPISAEEKPISSEEKPISSEEKSAAPAEKPRLEITPYLRLMVDKDASDLYFTTGARVNIKINGVTSPIGKKVLPAGTVREILPAILSAKQLAEFEQEMELDTAFTIENVGRFRINVFRQRGEEAIVIRQIKAKIPELDTLSLPQIVKALVMEQRGLIIIAGATGTGKSTTVATMLDYRNQNKTGHILTIEDPIEFIYEHKKSIVNQREVGIDTKSFDEALRRAMREAPDVIMIGEIRDASTMKQALSYADTGHLCIATLHATNAVQTLERINSFFPVANRDQLYMDMSLNLRAVIAQRLLIDKQGKRIPATEVLLNEPHVKGLMREGQIHKLKDVLEKAHSETAMHSFDNDILRLFSSKKITMEEALIHSDDPEHLKVKLRLGGGIASESEDIYSL